LEVQERETAETWQLIRENFIPNAGNTFNGIPSSRGGHQPARTLKKKVRLGKDYKKTSHHRGHLAWGRIIKTDKEGHAASDGEHHK